MAPVWDTADDDQWAAMTSFFDQVTRWQVRLEKDPAENRLTAVLGKDSQLTLQLLKVAWALDVKSGANPDVTAQHRVGRRAVDIQIAAGNDALVWVEAKYHAPLSGPDQLDNYLHDIRSEGRAAQRRVVLLIPAGRRGEDFQPPVTWDPCDQDLQGPRPKKVLGFTWQDVDRHVCAQSGGDAVDGWLKQQLHEFLSERGLADKPLDKSLVEAFTKRPELDETLEQLFRTADSQIAAAGWVPSDRRRRGPIYDSELEYLIRRRVGNWRSASRLVWGAYVDKDGAWFYAGLRCESGGPLTKTTNEEWITGLEADAFELTTRYRATREALYSCFRAPPPTLIDRWHSATRSDGKS